MQALNAVPELVAWCQSVTDEDVRPNSSIATAFVDLIRSMWRASYKSAITPSTFLRQMARADRRWGDMAQQDAQELLHALLEGLQNDTNAVQGKPAYKELSGKGSQEEQAAEAEAYSRWGMAVVRAS